MKFILPIVIVAAFVVPARADDCSEFRHAVRERDAARLLLMEEAAQEDAIGELMGELALAGIRVERLAETLVASQGDPLAADILQWLDEADSTLANVSGAASALGTGPQDPSTSNLREKALLVQFAIEETREALVYMLCP